VRRGKSDLKQAALLANVLRKTIVRLDAAADELVMPPAAE
jgi:hypothetical protein